MISLKKSNKGFTIIELLIVIVVIGILAAIVITTYSGVQAKARNTKRQSDVTTLASQIEVYYASSSHYPSLTDMDTGTSSTTNALSTWVTSNLKGLDQGGLVDPSNANGSHHISATVALATTNKEYSYAVTQADGITSCEADDTTCAKYTLTSIAETGGTNTVKTSLN